MKKTYISIIGLGIAACMSSCSDDFLEKLPQGNYVEETYYVSDKALEAAPAILYNRPWFEYNSEGALYISSMANECFDAWNAPEFNTMQVTALNPHLSNIWRSIYAVVTTSNSVIDACETKAGGECTEAGIHTAIGEARLMRAAAYFYALRFWGPMILFEHNQDIVDNPLQPLNKEEDVFRFIIRDLEIAADYLPETGVKGRATCWSAKALLAKVYLCRSGWNGGARNEADLDKCKTLCEEVINTSGLKLLPNYADLFKYKFNNNEESLLAMQWVPLGEWGTQNTLYSILSINDMTGGVGAWGSPFAPIEMLNQYERADTIRRNATYLTQFSFYPEINIAEGGYRYDKESAQIKKGAIGGPDDDNDGFVAPMSSPLNTYILRLADTYLTYAEACLGNKDKLTDGPGLDAFNKIRERAKIDPKRSITLNDIIRERRIEFCMEFTNWYEYISWFKWKPDLILNMINNQERGTRADKVKKDPDGELIFEGLIKPTSPVVVIGSKMFMPYPENDVIQNPRLKEEPVSYDFGD